MIEREMTEILENERMLAEQTLGLAEKVYSKQFCEAMHSDVKSALAILQSPLQANARDGSEENSRLVSLAKKVQILKATNQTLYPLRKQKKHAQAIQKNRGDIQRYCNEMKQVILYNKLQQSPLYLRLVEMRGELEEKRSELVAQRKDVQPDERVKIKDQQYYLRQQLARVNQGIKIFTMPDDIMSHEAKAQGMEQYREDLSAQLHNVFLACMNAYKNCYEHEWSNASEGYITPHIHENEWKDKKVIANIIKLIETPPVTNKATSSYCRMADHLRVRMDPRSELKPRVQVDMEPDNDNLGKQPTEPLETEMTRMADAFEVLPTSNHHTEADKRSDESQRIEFPEDNSRSYKP